MLDKLIFKKEIVMANKSPNTPEKEAAESADRGIIKPLVETGLPPGISEQRAKDPGDTPEKQEKNNP
jgi:hypothetical protein